MMRITYVGIWHVLEMCCAMQGTSWLGSCLELSHVQLCRKDFTSCLLLLFHGHVQNTGKCKPTPILQDIFWCATEVCDHYTHMSGFLFGRLERAFPPHVCPLITLDCAGSPIHLLLICSTNSAYMYMYIHHMTITQYSCILWVRKSLEENHTLALLGE